MPGFIPLLRDKSWLTPSYVCVNGQCHKGAVFIGCSFPLQTFQIFQFSGKNKSLNTHYLRLKEWRNTLHYSLYDQHKLPPLLIFAACLRFRRLYSLYKENTTFICVEEAQIPKRKHLGAPEKKGRPLRAGG